MKKKTILIVAVVILVAAVTIGGFGAKSAMKGGRLHRWLVVHSLRHEGVYNGEKIFEFRADGTFLTTPRDGRSYWRMFEIDANGTITEIQGDSTTVDEIYRLFESGQMKLVHIPNPASN
jgi:hypothetical protein